METEMAWDSEPQLLEPPRLLRGPLVIATQEFIMPFEKGRVTSMFNQGRRHPAIDLAGPLGTPVHATTRKQRVTFAGRQGGYGNLVITRDPSGRQHYYGHLQRIVAHVGALLDQGQLLGLLGSTGYSTGPHVHYEVRTSAGRHLDPSGLLFPDRRVSRGYAWNTPLAATTTVASRSGQPRPR
jgi:murein DD-endopeptidase MepM/ murein hydrolase activator NlpD